MFELIESITTVMKKCYYILSISTPRGLKYLKRFARARPCTFLQIINTKKYLRNRGRRDKMDRRYITTGWPFKLGL